MNFIGIDPGATGAIACINENGVSYAKFDREPALIWQAFQIIPEGEVFAVIERVGAMPRQGVKSMFTFGKATGMALGILYASKIPYVEVPPKKWIDAVLDSDLKASKDKSKSVHMVHRLYPDLNLKRSKHNEADAICIANYARMEYARRQGI